MDLSQQFREKLSYGKIAESFIASYFKNKGYAVLPIYEKEIFEGKGPTIFFHDAEFIGTDLLVLKQNKIYFVEAKHKNAFSWHRITKRWVTGIDLKHYEHYQEIEKRTGITIWIMFYHEGGKAKDSPPNSPRGLFGNKLSILKNNENHRHENWGKSGMVYWSVDKLIFFE